ncbi:MAG: hypothetical protein H7831_13865, partial [Magnetococcus sp. WYHC-3]
MGQMKEKEEKIKFSGITLVVLGSIGLLFISGMFLANSKLLVFDNGNQVAQVGGSGAGSQPHRQRVGVNLVTNPSINGVDGWSRAQYDETVTRSPGSGSLKLVSGSVTSVLIPVTPGKTYTFSAYMRSGSWPSSMRMFVGAYRANRQLIQHLGRVKQFNTTGDNWEEVSVIYKPKENEMFFDLWFWWVGEPSKGTIWIDDVYFGEGIGFEQPPTPKKSFDGSSFRVDSLGNFEKWNGSAYENFIPFCVCPDSYRTDWSVYTNAGFNCVTWSSATSQIRKAKNFGMVAGLDITAYIMFGAGYYKRFDHLAQRIRDVHDQGLDDSLLMYYFDNETDLNINPDNPMEMWTVAKEVFEVIDQTERSINGGRRIRPIYMLATNEGMTRAYTRYVDLVGDYVGPSTGLSTGGFDGGPRGLKILDNIEGQSAPLFAQINPQSDGSTKMRELIYQYFIGGAKGFSFWKDATSSNPRYTTFPDPEGLIPIEQTSWYTELPKVRQEVEQLNHVFRQPHWVNWTVQSSDSFVTMGGRDYQGEAYLILINEGGVTSPVQFDVSGLTYTPSAVQDAFTGENVASFNGGSFSYSFGGKETAVLRLLSNSNSPQNGSCSQTLNTCTTGTFSDIADTDTNHLWQCLGSNGGTNASCSLPKDVTTPVNGICSTSLNQCTKGVFSDIDDSSTNYLWKCEGQNGGTTASCSLPKNTPINGSCSTTLNTCTTGAFFDTADSS